MELILLPLGAVLLGGFLGAWASNGGMYPDQNQKEKEKAD